MTQETEATIIQRVAKLNEHRDAIRDYKSTYFSEFTVIRCSAQNYTGYGIVRKEQRGWNPELIAIEVPNDVDPTSTQIDIVPIESCSIVKDSNLWPQWVKDNLKKEAIRRIQAAMPVEANILGITK